MENQYQNATHIFPPSSSPPPPPNSGVMQVLTRTEYAFKAIAGLLLIALGTTGMLIVTM